MFETTVFSLSTACFAFLLCAFQTWGQQCTKQAKMPKFMELTFYLHGKLVYISSHQLWLLRKGTCSQTGTALPPACYFSTSKDSLCFGHPNVFLSYPGEGMPFFPQQPSSSYVFLIAFWTFSKSCFSALSDAALRIAFRVAR